MEGYAFDGHSIEPEWLIPNIADEVLKIVVGEIREYAEPYEGAKWLNEISAERLIKSLTQGTTSTKKGE